MNQCSGRTPPKIGTIETVAPVSWYCRYISFRTAVQELFHLLGSILRSMNLQLIILFRTDKVRLAVTSSRYMIAATR